MSTAARFDTTRVELTPGGEATCVLTVANRGQVVESYTLRPVGALAPFVRVQPAQFSLYPDTEAESVVTFTVPRSPEVLAGEADFAVFVQPTEDPDATAVPELVAAVDGYVEIDTELFPRTSQARRSDRHSLAVDNLGNHPVRIDLSGENPDDDLTVRCRPETLVVGPGETAFASVAVRARRLMWKGAPQTRPFKVDLEVRDAGDGPLGEFTEERGSHQLLHVVDGRFVQLSLLPRAFGKLIGLVAAGLVALLVVWFAVLKPTVRSAAQEAVAEPVAAVQQQAAAAQEQAEVAQEQAAVAGEEATAATDAAAGAAAGTPEEKAAQAQEAAAQVQAGKVSPFTQRIVVTAAPGEGAEETFLVPENQLVKATDLVFESRGDIGAVRLLRDDDVLITVRPENFRTLDQHFVSPVVFTEGERIVYELQCDQPAQPALECEAALFVNGTIEPEPPPPPPPVAPLPPAEDNLPPAPGAALADPPPVEPAEPAETPSSAVAPPPEE